MGIEQRVRAPASDAPKIAPAPAPSLASILGDQAPRRKRILGRVWQWLLLAVAIVAGSLLLWTYYGQGSVYTYTTQKVTRGDLTVVVTATGSVQPVAQVDVSSEISGIIRKVNVDYNSEVHRGQVLAELDTDKLQATVASSQAKLVAANANVAKAKATLNAAKATYDRQLVLFERSVMSAQSLEDTRLTMDAADAALKAVEADVLVAEADLRTAETNLTKAQIISPIDGVVLTRNVDEGSTVAASLQAPVLFSIAGDLKQMEVQVDVDEADIGSVAIGQTATFTVDAYRDRSFPAVITDIRFVSETINNVVTYKALLKVDNTALLLRPGMTATADIVVETVKSALLVPNAAMRYSPPTESSSSGGFLGMFRPPRMGAVTTAEVPGGARTVWVMRDKIPTEKAVVVGATDGQNTQLISGDLKEGDELVVDAVAAE
ncbi:MAG: efflux RND transporter periplasmic adaptor subunit [Mesorhizobium sp.]|nr:MAG: efflux RND transporter periplasmic adaptor subunit [Mesorhizobium sp.]TIO74273.1 MAG: efflux RND transporter periplasmic adaptor subunit [Mesorhizobium sp.]TIO82188.1 MAG: efflux RND transporter periplasmic adaptor subunit [Mesorhizobium sp.]TJV49164.1 MAG: efflux RND transporter periplasmic adaptor subunit [Mesorhizobium sp.]